MVSRESGLIMFEYKFKENESNQLFRAVAADDINKLFLCDDKTVACSFVCQPASGWDTQMLSTIELMLSQDTYPVGTMISFSLWSSPDIRPHLQAADVLRRNCRDELMRESHDNALGFLWGGTRNAVEVIQHTKIKNFQLIVTLKMPISAMEISHEEVEKIVSLQRTMEQRLQKSYLSPVQMNSEMLVNIMNVMLHWKDSAEWRCKQSLPVENDRVLNEQFLQYDTNVYKQRDGVVLGDKEHPTFVKMLTVRRFPRSARTGQAFKWFGDPFDGLGCVTQNFIITVNMHYPDNVDAKAKLETKKNHYIKQSFGALTQFAPKIKNMRADLDEITKSINEDGKTVNLTISAAVFGENETDAADGITALQSFMNQSGLSMVNEDSFAIPSFIQILPFGACRKAVAQSRRYFTLSSKHVMPILPLFSEWKGTGTPTMQFVSRTGQLMNIDLFDSKTNYNAVIYAESGAGKSFLTNEIIRAYLSTGNKIWTIDAGESYKKLSESFDGKFTTVDGRSSLSFNPFTMIPEDDPRAFKDSLEMLAGCILAMAFTKQAPTDLQSSEVERILCEVWAEKGQSALIDDVKAKCLEDEDINVRNIGKQLTAFTSTGQFGEYFDKPHNVAFDGNFNVLELDGLSDTPRLQAVVLFMLMVQISHSMYKEFKEDRSIKRIVIIDEAWDLLGNSPAVTAFMEKGFRRFRKYNGCGIVITQSILDLQTSEAGKAIAANAANSLILKQKDSTITSAEKDNLMSLPKAGYRLLKKVTTELGHYSEIFFNTNNGMGIGRLIVDPLRVVMYSTRAQDNELIDDQMVGGKSLTQAMKAVVVEKRMVRYSTDKPKFLTDEVLRMDSMMEANLMNIPMKGCERLPTNDDDVTLKVVGE